MRYFIERGRALAKSHPDIAHGDALLSSEVIWNTLKN